MIFYRMIDIDECSSGRAICPSNSECVNTIGGAYCRCLPGFEKRGGKCKGTHCGLRYAYTTNQSWNLNGKLSSYRTEKKYTRFVQIPPS